MSINLQGTKMKLIDLVGKKVAIKYDQNLMLPYLCTVVEVREDLDCFKVKEFNLWYKRDALLCHSYDEYMNMIMFMKRQLDNMSERNRQAEKDLKDEIQAYMEQVNLWVNI